MKSGDTDHIDVGLYQTGDYLSEIDLGTPASMRNAWGQFGGQRKLGLSVLTSAVFYAALVGCDPLTVMEESDPSMLAVMYSGCHTVQEGPLCELPKLDTGSATLPLTLHIELRDMPTITIRTVKDQTSWTSAQCSTTPA